MKKEKSQQKLSNTHMKKNKSLNSLHINYYKSESSGLSSTVLNYVNKRLNELKLDTTSIHSQGEPKMVSSKSTKQINFQKSSEKMMKKNVNKKSASNQASAFNSGNKNITHKTKPIFREQRGINNQAEILMLKEENNNLNEEIISYQVKIKMLQEEIKKLNAFKLQKIEYEKQKKNRKEDVNDDLANNTIQTLSVSITEDNIEETKKNRNIYKKPYNLYK